MANHSRALVAAAFAAFAQFIFPAAVQAELILSAPPRESAEDGEAIYGPLAEGLSKVLGTKVTYQHPVNWPSYGKQMRAGHYDLAFDAPHFGSWRIEHVNHQPIATLPGVLDFVIVSTNKEYNSTKDLVGKRFCGLASPNMGTLTVQHLYKNPVRQPTFVYVTGGFSGVYKSLIAGKCEAAVLRAPFYRKKLNDTQRSELKLLHTSRPTPNQTLTGGPRLSADQKTSIREALTNPANIDFSQALFNRFSKGSRAWIEPNPMGYAYLNLLLEGHAWGWEVN